MAKKSKENDIEVTRFFTIFATIAAAIFHLELEKVFSKNVHIMFNYVPTPNQKIFK